MVKNEKYLEGPTSKLNYQDDEILCSLCKTRSKTIVCSLTARKRLRNHSKILTLAVVCLGGGVLGNCFSFCTKNVSKITCYIYVKVKCRKQTKATLAGKNGEKGECVQSQKETIVRTDSQIQDFGRDGV